MLQQGIAIIIIFFFVFRLFWQKRKKKISINEFYFWLFFAILALLLIVFIKKIDIFLAELGFSSAGIDVIAYLGIVVLLYFIFRLRIRLEKIEREITQIARKIALKE